jgi:peptide deformylase
MITPIVRVSSDVLTHSAKTVTSFDKRLGSLITEMKTALLATRNPKGVGLAAPQVGQSLRVFITKDTPKSPIRIFVNARITSKVPEEPDKDGKLEGCLSIPTIWGKVKRAHEVTIDYQDENGKPHHETLKGFLATIIQHEIDHTNGILFTQRVLEQKGKLYQTTKDKEGKEELEEVTI